MKKRFCTILMLVLFSCMAAMPAHADMGPKPSVNITVEGLQGKEYAISLIAPYEYYGPWSIEREYSEENGAKESWDAFKAYKDADGYNFLGYWVDCDSKNQMNWDYMSPPKFKVIIWVKENNTCLVSDPMERYAFDSYYVATVNAAGDGMQIRKSYDYTWEIISFVCRVLVTIAIELAVAWLFGWRNKQEQKVLLYTNVVTQLALNVVLNAVNYYRGCVMFSFAFVTLELVVFLVEGIVYSKKLPRVTSSGKKRSVWAYALFANAFSYLAGFELAKWIPGIF